MPTIHAHINEKWIRLMHVDENGLKRFLRGITLGLTKGQKLEKRGLEYHVTENEKTIMRYRIVAE